MALEAGAQVGPYRIKGPLGRGGMASVYTAYEASLDRDVALKVLPAEFLHDPDFAARFNREARVIARLEHPNIVPIYAFGIDEARRLPWMAMRLVPGGALSSLLRRGRLPYDRVLAILRGAADALDYAHEHGVIHRDVKPQNILLDEAERVYLADFGIAKMLESGGGLTQTGMIAGTPQYMAPEQATATSVDRRADIYAVGIVAYEMFTGRVPFAADTPVAVLMKQVSEPLPRPAPGEVPESVVEALLRCTAKRPDERWPTTREFVRALDDALAPVALGSGPTLDTAPMPVDPRPTLRPAPTAEAALVGERTAVSPRTAPAVEPAVTRPGSRTATAPGVAVPAGAPTSISQARGGLSQALLVGVVAGGGALLLAAGFGVVLWLRGARAPSVPAAEPPRSAEGPVARAPDGRTPPPAASPQPQPTLATPTRPPASVPRQPRPVESQLPPVTSPARSAPPATPLPTRPSETRPAPPSEPPLEVRELLADLRDSTHKDERVSAALELGDHRRDAAWVVPALGRALTDRSEDVRLRAAEALGKFGPDAGPALDDLVRALEGPDMVATEVAKTLGKLGPVAARAVPGLASALARSDVYLRRETARALARLGALAEPAVDALGEALERDRDKTVRQQAADALGAIGPPARRALPALRRAAADRDDLVARKARAALEKIGADP